MERLPHFQIFHQVLPRVPKNFKVDILRGTIVCVVGNQLLLHEGIQVLLVVLSPSPWWKFCNFEPGTGVSVCTLCHPKTPFIPVHFTFETPEPRFHGYDIFTAQYPLDIFLDVIGVEGWDIATETRPDTLRSIYQNHGHSRHVKIRFDGSPVIIQIIEDGIIFGVEKFSSLLGELRENVPRLRRILTTHEACTELTTGFKKIDVVRTRIIIGQLDDRFSEGNFAMMVSTLFSHICRQLCILHLIFEILLET